MKFNSEQSEQIYRAAHRGWNNAGNEVFPAKKKSVIREFIW